MFSKNLISIPRERGERELNSSRRKAFTLIELLVVIAVIGLLSSIVLVNMGGVRAKARDAKRLADLYQIQLALGMFYNEYEFYPPYRVQTACGAWGNRSTSAATACGGNQWLTSDPNFAKYMPSVPVDPINQLWYAEDGAYTYTYTSGVNDYDLRTLLEDSSNPKRCEKNCYKTHIFTGSGNAWCANHPVGSPCGGTPFWDDSSRPLLYSDH